MLIDTIMGWLVEEMQGRHPEILALKEEAPPKSKIPVISPMRVIEGLSVAYPKLPGVRHVNILSRQDLGPYLD